MDAKWQPVNTDLPGVTRYRKGFSRAEIQREPDGDATATLKEGFLGLGTHVSSFHRGPAPDDQAILGRLEETAHPPRFSNWREVPGDEQDAVRHYEGQASRGRKVEAAITRVDGEAEVKARAGFFGVQVEGHFFAPAPSDQEILRRISR